MDARERSLRRSLTLHAAVRDLAKEDPSRLDEARARVAEWLKTGAIHAFYAQAWHDLLSKSKDEILDALIDPSERMNTLRKTSPFAGALDARTRWRLLRQVADETR